jgi:hypothetical protein
MFDPALCCFIVRPALLIATATRIATARHARACDVQRDGLNVPAGRNPRTTGRSAPLI